MDKVYEPKLIEKKWAETWEQRGWFQPAKTGEPYCVMLPPPNVTGSLHMGHAFQDTLMDALIRYHRMRGRRALWQGGTDHAGIATQMVVERQLAQKSKTRHDLGRDDFVAEVWRWKEESGGTITRQLRRMGASLDWTRERFTMDEGLSKAVTEVFVRLHEEGLIYRGKRLVNWDPMLHTAISDLEVIAEEEQGQLWHIRYPYAEGRGHVVVATTRPETMLGDAAVAVHPEDERYKHLVGKQLVLPLTGRKIPVIADEYVDPEFGSGCVKITPAHDFNDYAVWQRHKEEDCFRSQPQNGLINIFTPDASIKKSELDDFTWGHRAVDRKGVEVADGEGLTGALTYTLIPEIFRGMDRFKARKQIVSDLEAQGLIEKIEPHKLMVPRGDRSHVVIEPYLTDQWYVKIEPLAKEAVRTVEDGRIKFVPENWAKTYYEWMRNIQDWCISRQLWWGHRIPAWYDEQGRVYVGRTEEEVRAKHKLPAKMNLTQDVDVLDTWFSSALWPFSTLGWPEQTAELKAFYPTSVLVTGFDIIFFWVARMIMMGLKFMGDVPFREVYFHGLVRDADGNKMSKSKGNILDPLDLIDGIDPESLVKKRTTGLMRPQDAPKIEKATRREFPDGIAGYGTDALRFTFAALATQGRDIRFDVKRIEGYRNFCNKLWNAARFVLMMVEGQEQGLRTKEVELGPAERWIRSRLQHVITAVVEYFAGYRFDLAAQAIYEFAWDEFCDWYLELSKTVLNDAKSGDAMKAGTRQTLITTLETLLRLAHPIMPFITEEIWQRVAPIAGIKGETIMLQTYPQPDAALTDSAAERELKWVKSFVLGVRRIRAETNTAPGKPLSVGTQGGSDEENRWLETSATAICIIARITLNGKQTSQATSESATALVGGMTLQVPLADLIDPRAELARLDKEIARLQLERQRVEAKLANENYVSRAPAEVVAKERARLEESATAITQLSFHREKIARLKH
ncbi:MAG TPA: valine--tRNA ligase [Gammaproteobacteria bacterium]|nr:valine--tRNA ligase [Gammaproteobacteria bacterium]